MSGRTMQSNEIEPFRVAVPDGDLDDLRDRLARTRWPDAVGAPWQQGTDLAYLRELVAYWREAFDWRAAEARINAFPQFRVDVGDLKIHCLHVRGNGPAPLPLVITHGWPGSVAEMLDIIPRLTDPERFGGDRADAFDVVVPSLPGYGFSDRPAATGIGIDAVADRWATLMSRLGYDRFGAQGGDWGSGASVQLAVRHPARLIGVHLNFIQRGYLPPLASIPAPTAAEQAYYEDSARWIADEAAYSHLHGTKPQSLAYALNDSPAGLAAWIVEKFRTWSDCDGDVERAFSRDALLTNISIYWLTQTIGSSMRLYWERQQTPSQIPSGARLQTPIGFASFPKEITVPPRSLLERVFDLARYTEMPRGGHFAALEQPELLAGEIRAFFRPLR